MTGGVIGKITAGGGTHLVTATFYGTCATAKGTAAKIVKLSDTTVDSVTLITGMTLAVKFTAENTVANPTLTVQTNGGTELIAAKSIMRYGTTAVATNAATSWRAGAIVLFVYDGTNWIEVTGLDSNDNTYDRTFIPNDPYIAGTGGLMQYSLCMRDADNKLQSFTTTNGTGTSKTKNTAGFVPGKVYYHGKNGNISSGTRVDNSTIYITMPFDSRYSTNAGANLVYSGPLYIVFTYSNGLLYLDNTWWATSIPAEENGKLYLFVGMCYNSNKYSCFLEPENPIYYYYNGAVRLWNYKEVVNEILYL